MPEHPSKLIPIALVGPYGRTGSTAVMHLLATSPHVAMERVYPFEYRYLTYLIHWTRLLQQSCQPAREWNFDLMQSQSRLEVIGPVPYEDSCLAKPVPGTVPLPQRCLRTLWPVLASHFRATLLPASMSASARYYAEKMPHWAYAFLRETLSDTRGIFTLRDPRDVYLSGLAFDRKRGYVAFGPAQDPSTEEAEAYLRGFVQSSLERLRRVRQAQLCDKEFVLHYEKWVTDYHTESSKLADWLGLQLDPEAVFGHSEVLQIHGTSPSPTASVYRWKRELPPEINRFFVEQLGEELAALGYEV